MRGLAFLVIAGAFFAYAVLHSGNLPAPASPTKFAELPPTKAAPAPQAQQRPETARLARAPGPLDISPQVQNAAPAKPVATPAPSPTPSNAKRTAEVLTAAAIAALIVEASRKAYYATGHPCACPDDRMRNGRACGSRSAYSRPGGASPLCSPADVTEAMIKSYRSRVAER
jgi:hypothetical protein